MKRLLLIYTIFLMTALVSSCAVYKGYYNEIPTTNVNHTIDSLSNSMDLSLSDYKNWFKSTYYSDSSRTDQYVSTLYNKDTLIVVSVTQFTSLDSSLLKDTSIIRIEKRLNR